MIYLSGYNYSDRVSNSESAFTASAVHGVEWPVLRVGCFTGKNVGRYPLRGVPHSVCELCRTWHIAHSAHHSIDYKDKIHIRIEGKINSLNANNTKAMNCNEIFHIHIKRLSFKSNIYNDKYTNINLH